MPNDEASAEQTISYNRKLLWIMALCMGFILLIPAMSVWELVSTGQIDFEAVSGRRHIPVWQLYLVGWILFILALPMIVYTSVKYLTRGWVFKIDDDSITIDAETIHVSEIEGIKETWRGVRISTPEKRVYFHPRMGVSGYQIFEEFRQKHGLHNQTNSTD